MIPMEQPTDALEATVRKVTETDVIQFLFENLYYELGGAKPYERAPRTGFESSKDIRKNGVEADINNLITSKCATRLNIPEAVDQAAEQKLESRLMEVYFKTNGYQLKYCMKRIKDAINTGITEICGRVIV